MSNNLLSINDLSKKEILDLIDFAKNFKQDDGSFRKENLFPDKTIANVFCEPSTRTKFEGISNFSFNSLTFCSHPSMSTKYSNPALGRYEPDLDSALHDADVVMTLRIQYERFEETLDLNLNEYKQAYQLTSEKLEQAKGDAIVMHPGPVNYVEITESVYQSEQSVIRNQIANGVAIRMAVLSRFLSS